MCCGSGTRAARGPVVDNIQYVEAVYSPPNGKKGEVSLYSSTRIDPITKRRLLISPAATAGDIVYPPVSDVLQNPSLYRSTCGDEFIRKGNMVIDPCADKTIPPLPPRPHVTTEESTESMIAKYGVPPIALSWADAEGQLEETFGPMATKAIRDKYGHISVGDIFRKTDAQLEKELGKRISKIIIKRRPND